MKTTYPSEKVECKFNDSSIGYELFRDNSIRRVTTVSADVTVAAARVPSSPWIISGMSAHPASLRSVLNSSRTQV